MSGIDWGTGSGFNLGRIPHSEIRVERVKDQEGKWYFLLSDSAVGLTYIAITNATIRSLR